jgi:Domain of unknown function (DUF4350)
MMAGSQSDTNGLRAPRRVWILAAVAVVGAMIAVLGFLGTPGQAGAPGRGPLGTLALRRVLSEMGASVSFSAMPPPPPATYVLLFDLRDDTADRSLLDWAASGGRLVVADPSSRVGGLLGVTSNGPLGGPFSDASRVAPGCALPETVGVDSVAVAWDDATLEHAPASAVTCFHLAGGDYELSIPRGQGTVVLLGGFSPFTNELLTEGDDARFALGVLRGSGGAVVAFGPPLPPGATGAPTSLWAALPEAAKAAIVGLGLALVAAVLVAGRRLGRPVQEDLLAPIPASELAEAAAALYRRSRAVGHAGTLLRAAARQRMARGLGLPSAAGELEVVHAVARASGIGEDRIREGLSGSEPATDHELIVLGKELEELARAVESST